MLASQLETLIDAQALQSQDPEDRYLTTGVSWQQYEVLLAQLGDRSGYHLRQEAPAAFIQTYGYEELTRSELLPQLDIALLAMYVQQPHPLTAVKEFRQRLQEQRNRY